jgi:hypothetical protein
MTILEINPMYRGTRRQSTPSLTAAAHNAARRLRSHKLYLLRCPLDPQSVREHDAQYYSRFTNGVMLCVKRNGRNTINLWKASASLGPEDIELREMVASLFHLPRPPTHT